MQYLVQPQKWQNDLCSSPRQTFQYHSNPNLCPNPKCQRSWSWTVLRRPIRPSRTNTKKEILFIIGNWNAKVGNQEITGVTDKFGLGIKNEERQRLTEFCQQNGLVTASTLFQQHETTLCMEIIRRSILKSDWLHSLQPKMEKFYTVSKNNIGSWPWLISWTPYWKIQT